MGYHVTILRTRDGATLPIGAQELGPALQAMGDKLSLGGNTEGGLYVYETVLGEESEVAFVGDGELWAKNPSERCLQWMIELANRLGARVRGDEYETYRSVDEAYEHPDDAYAIQAIRKESEQRAQAARRRSRIVWAIRIVVGSLALFGLVRRWLAPA